MSSNLSAQVPQRGIMQRYMLWPKILYFSLYMAIYSANGIQSTYMYKKWGLKPSTIGFVLALQGINFFGAIFWTGRADKTGKHRILLIIGTLISSLMLFINGVPKIFQYEMSVPVEMVYMCSLLTISWFFQSAMFPLLDSAMISLLSKEPGFSKDQFGLQRLFGSPAHPIACIVQGFTQFAPKPWDVIFYQSVALGTSLLFSLFIWLGVPEFTNAMPKSFGHHGHKDAGKPTHLSQATALPLAPSPIVPAAPDVDTQAVKNERSPVVRLLTDPGFMFYLLFVVSAGLLANTLTLYQQVAATIMLGGSTQTQQQPIDPKDAKWAVVKAAMSKLPSMCSEIIVFLSSKFLMRTLGVYWLLILSQVFGIARILAYSFARKKFTFVLLCVIESIKGFNTGLIVSAGVRVASDLALPGCSNSAQGLFSGTYKGISITLAGLIGGGLLILLNEDIPNLFFWVGIFSSATTFLFFLKFLLVDRTLGLLPRKEKAVPAVTHDTTSTTSFGSVASGVSASPAQPEAINIVSSNKLGV